jgi:hypothetical protein
MRRSIIALVSAGVAVSALLPLRAARSELDLGSARLAAETTSSLTQNDVMAVRFFGRFANESTQPGLVVFTGDLLSPTGERVGTLTHQARCSTTAPPPCVVFDVVDTFQFPEGTIVNEAHASGPADPQHPDRLLIGVHQPESRIVETTGIFAGRTGKAHMSGWHHIGELPGYASFDDFWLIEFDPR